MSAFGGYTKTEYGTQGGDSAGGFAMGGTQQGSQGGSSKYTEDRLRPVTIKQIIESSDKEGTAVIDGIPANHITLVGQIRDLKAQVTNITYQVDDGTGVFDVKKWIEPDRPAVPQFERDTYVRVFGRLLSYNGRNYITAHFIRAIEDFNEVNYHLLEATYVHLYLTKGAGGGGGGGGGDAGGDSMFVDEANGARASGGVNPSKLNLVSRNAKTVFGYLQSSTDGDEGSNAHKIAQDTRLSRNDVISAADELLGLGVIYTTMDDETWAILDC